MNAVFTPSPSGLRYIALTVVLATLLGGCATALRRDALPDPALAAIQTAFERTVAAAHEDPTIDWQSGWVGNALINLFGGSRQGLCYQWRNLVYAGVRPTLKALGWEATSIVMSKGTYSEHSAVVVYDPRRVGPDELLTATADEPVYVLDAWRRGRADIYPLERWLTLPIIVRSPARLQPLREPDAPEAPPTPASTPSASPGPVPGGTGPGDVPQGRSKSRTSADPSLSMRTDPSSSSRAPSPA